MTRISGAVLMRLWRGRLERWAQEGELQRTSETVSGPQTAGLPIRVGSGAALAKGMPIEVVAVRVEEREGQWGQTRVSDMVVVKRDVRVWVEWGSWL